MSLHHTTVKTCFSTLMIAAAFLSLAGCSTQKRQSASLIQGRTVNDWVVDVEIGGFPGDKNPGLDALISAGPQVMPKLARLLLGSESPDKQAKAAYVMGAIAYRNQDAALVHDAVPALTKAAQSSDCEVRIYSVQALGAVGRSASKAAPTLLRLTRDENASVRMCAVEALGGIGVATPASVAALTVAMSDTSDDVRVTAKKALEAVQKGHK